MRTQSDTENNKSQFGKKRSQKYQFLKLSKDLAEFPWANMPAIFYTEVVSISVQSKLALSSEPRRMNTH